ncbi:hypothetical protein [Embleya sp. NPDC050493]|uniref:hypothetical protein n=1 Tax=Embleya sp. NPDC050493 TaxID=3363989 RepID=UPI00378D9624
MNVAELLDILRQQHDHASTHADGLRHRIDELTTALGEMEEHLTEPTTTRKIVDGLVPAETAPLPAEPAAVYRDVVKAFSENPQRRSASATYPNTSACPRTTPR